MVASHKGEARIFTHWWASWFGEPMQICSAEEKAAMPGLLDTAAVAKLQSTAAASFDSPFVELMTEHHKGAVAVRIMRELAQMVSCRDPHPPTRN
jgi:uncharacterized protein (DUF305 family)